MALKKSEDCTGLRPQVSLEALGNLKHQPGLKGQIPDEQLWTPESSPSKLSGIASLIAIEQGARTNRKCLQDIKGCETLEWT